MLRFRDQARTAVIVATGPSAGRADLAALEGWPTVVVNDGYRLCREADALYAADTRWWQHHEKDVRESFKGSLWTCDAGAARRFNLQLVALERKPGLSHKPGTIRAGGEIGNSGAQAINLAYLWGARRLVLIGFDMHDGGTPHFFGHHPKGLMSTTHYSTFVRQMSGMAADLCAAHVEVINTSLESALPYWPKRPLDEALAFSP